VQQILKFKSSSLLKDLIAGLVVFLVAIPLCLGIALASNAPLVSGLVTGIFGGVLVGFLSGSHTSVSGPAAGLTAVVSYQIAKLGSFEFFLVAVLIGGVIQILLGVLKVGAIAAFFPNNIIKGLLAAIGIILILKQIPHVFGHDPDPFGNKSFFQIDNKNTFTEIIDTFFNIQIGPAIIGLSSLFLLIIWDKVHFLKTSLIPSPLIIVLFGVSLKLIFNELDTFLTVESTHLVQVPLFKSVQEFVTLPDFNALKSFDVYVAAITIALVASLETLLNIEAVDKIDPLQRVTPPNRELIAQGIGNVTCGLLGGLPMTSVIIRSSVNINAGGQTKLSAIIHGVLLILSLLLVPSWLNQIPLSALAAILLMTGYKLSSPKIIKEMWNEGLNQFLPFITTVIAIVLSDILTGIIIGLIVSIGFILNSYVRRPIKKSIEKHHNGDEVLHIELPNQVSFLNRAALEATLKGVKNGGHILIDANNTDYIDPDILSLIKDFQKEINKTHNVSLSLLGFQDKYGDLEDEIRYIDFTSRETQSSLTPERVLEILKEGNLRFRKGKRLTRDVGRLIDATSTGQYPMAVILSCIDSRSPAELIFDLGLGDIFSVRIAGNVVSEKILGSIEFGCAVAGAKLIVVLGHTSCGAITTAVNLMGSKKTAEQATGCVNLNALIEEIQGSITKEEKEKIPLLEASDKEELINEIAKSHVLRMISLINERSSTLKQLIDEGKVEMIGGVYNISTGEVLFFNPKT
jgi:carbonic anhydrase/SulP family sulfate permease